MRLCISKCKRRAPRTAKDVPFIDFEVLAKTFEVFDQIPGRVFFQARTRCRFSGSSLIQEDDLVLMWVEEAAIFLIVSSAGTTMKEDDCSPVSIS